MNSGNCLNSLPYFSSVCVDSEVALINAIEFLLSDKTDWFTGEVLNIDGGVMAGRN